MSPDLSKMSVLVTPTSYGRSDPALKRDLEQVVGRVDYNTTGKPLAASDLVKVIAEYDGFIAGLDEINRTVIEAASKLRVIARYGVGVDRVDLQAARERGIVVTVTPGANSSAVAELTIGLMLALARNVTISSEKTRQGDWPRIGGIAIEGKTVGLLGLGAIGREVAARLRPFGATLVGYDPFVVESQAAAMGVRLLPRDEVIASAHFLSLHLPVTTETREMVNAELLGRMRQGAFLINTSRGELVEENALFEALKSGRLAGAALDAFQKEPPGAENPLLSLPNVIATPHAGANTDEAANKMGRMALRDCLAVLRGESAAWPVDA